MNLDDPPLVFLRAHLRPGTAHAPTVHPTQIPNSLHGAQVLFSLCGVRPRHFGSRDVPHDRGKNRADLGLHRPPVHRGADLRAALDQRVKIANCDYCNKTIVPESRMQCMRCMHLNRDPAHTKARQSASKTHQLALKSHKNGLISCHFALFVTRLSMHICVRKSVPFSSQRTQITAHTVRRQVHRSSLENAVAHHNLQLTTQN